MDCDKAFFALTRGPFPSGRADDLAVERHLEECLDCWRIAEALKPTNGLFHEATPSAESSDLPGYWGDAAPPGVTTHRAAEAAPASGGPATLAARQQVASIQVRPPGPAVASRSDLLRVLGIVVGVVAVAGLARWILA